MELGYEDFPDSSAVGRLLPADGDRYYRAHKLFRIGGITAGVVGALALIGVVSTVQVTPAAAPSSQIATFSSTPAVVKDYGKMMASRQTGRFQALASSAPDTRVFDDAGRFIMHDFDRAKPMASFLPGVGGLWGVPMWAFYVNRGQGMATFGVENKDGGIQLFQTAEKTYQVTPYTGFRTLLKGKRPSGSFEAQPFMPQSDGDPKVTADRKMYIGNNEMEVEESDPTTGIRTNALYFTAPNELFPAMIRRVTYTNEGDDDVELQVVDGLAKLEPAGTMIAMIAAMGRTLEGWMQVYNIDKEKTAPFFHLVTAPADTADVTLIKEGHFAMAFVEDDATLDGTKQHELLPIICDQQLLFGTDTTLAVPRAFFSSAETPGGIGIDALAQEEQSTTSRTPAAFSATTLKLKPGESKTVALILGHAPDLDTFTSDIMPKLRTQGYVSTKMAEARQLGTDLTERVAMSSGAPLMDNYAKQNYLDNVLRGGMPMEMGVTPGAAPKIYHTFSRIHGDLERDYNNFELEQSFYSQGPGNFRDVNQNRRCDILQMPSVYDFNVRQFLTYVQADGYNQLTVANAFYKIYDAWRVHDVAAQITPPGPMQTALITLLMAPFRPGQLFNDMRKKGITIKAARSDVLNLVTKYAAQVPAGAYAQNGFWTDHFTYHLDLVHNFLSVFPDQKEAMLYDSEPIPFYLSPGRVCNRTEKNMLAVGDKVRQYDAVASSPKKAEQLAIMMGKPDFVGDTGSAGTFQLTKGGEEMKVSIIAKLAILAANKFSHMDPLGMGLEMEAGKPGWNDAMNGLPALFGSEMPSAYELHEIIDFVATTVDEVGRSVEFPEEVAALLDDISTHLDAVGSGKIKDFEYWDKTHDSLEAYRSKTEATFTGNKVAYTVEKLGGKKGVFGKMLARMDQGVERALSYAPDPAKKIAPTYFRFDVADYELVGVSGRGLPTVKVTEYEEPEALPLFLEGPVRYLKTIKAKPTSEKLAVYKAVEASDLYDTELKMYKLGASLKGQPLEIGRMMAFTSGWLENESIWLHMSYKWYLELLRAGLYAQFFKEIQNGVVCFMNTKVFGRSPLEASSFIVSSAFPDKALHGSGFLARLSGTTAEFLSMWNHMMVGPTPFTTDAKGALQISLAPVIASWMWREDGTLLTKFLGSIQLTYVMKAKKNSWDAKIKSYDIEGDGTKLHIDGATVPMPTALDVRSLKYSKITVTLE
jgi:hypothetical protein